VHTCPSEDTLPGDAATQVFGFAARPAIRLVVVLWGGGAIGADLQLPSYGPAAMPIKHTYERLSMKYYSDTVLNLSISLRNRIDTAKVLY
jgi:hypothetical protein